MNPTLIRKAAALPARQLHLIGAGLLLIVAAALWFYGLRAPLAALRAVRAEQAQLDLAGKRPAPARRATGGARGRYRNAGETAGRRRHAQPSAQLLVRLIGELGALAQAQGVTLHGVTPAPEETVLAFTQAGFDAEVSGPYASLLAWMRAIEQAQPNLAIASFEMRPADTPGQVAMKIRIAAFRPQESTP